jgi:DNA-binding transcriptional regulator GbsR (MarR family)
MDSTEQIRKDFATAWGKIGAAWGVAPSTATVQGYLLLHGGPLSEAEVRAALDLSHRAALMALTECESWGLIERAPESRRTGRRGPAGKAWVPVGDHWEWFRRVAEARKARETDPVLPLLDQCLRRAREERATELSDRLTSLVTFVHQFDRGVGAVVRSDPAAIAHLFGVLGRLDDRTLDRLLAAVVGVPQEDLVKAAKTVAGMRPSLLRRLIGLAGQPGLVRILSRLA